MLAVEIDERGGQKDRLPMFSTGNRSFSNAPMQLKIATSYIQISPLV